MKDASAAILELLAQRADGLTICPSEAARALDSAHWRDVMPMVHDAARTLVDTGEIVLTQSGAIKTPGEIVGAYRIRRA